MNPNRAHFIRYDIEPYLSTGIRIDEIKVRLVTIICKCSKKESFIEPNNDVLYDEPFEWVESESRIVSS